MTFLEYILSNVIRDIVFALCFFAILLAVIINFIESADRKGKEIHRKNSLVETGSMFGFFVIFYLVLRLRISTVFVTGAILYAAIAIGCILAVFGTFINIKGRFDLKKNWGNQIRIYKDHYVVDKGVYRFVRHPLYASLMLIFFAASIAYCNPLAFALNLAIFIPFMYYRAHQEEVMLEASLKEYKNYKSRTGMFFPKLR